MSGTAYVGAPAVTSAFIPVLTVCEALKEASGGPCHQLIVIVGIFKSGMDETLRLDCPEQLRFGRNWMAERDRVDATFASLPMHCGTRSKRSGREVIASAPPEAPLRPERVIGLYGSLCPLPRCGHAVLRAPIETGPPARPAFRHRGNGSASDPLTPTLAHCENRHTSARLNL